MDLKETIKQVGSPHRPGRWKLVCRDGRSFSAVLTDPDGNILPLVQDILISVDCQKGVTEVLYIQVAGVKLKTPRVEECVELDLEFQKNTIIKALRIPKNAL